MRTGPKGHTLTLLAREAVSASGLRLLVLHGSRARGDAHARSDWDFGYQADTPFDPDRLLARLSETLSSNRVDLIDLDRASALLRYLTAAEGVAIYEQMPRAFEQFRIDAVTTWCDLAPILEPAYAATLARLHS